MVTYITTELPNHISPYFEIINDLYEAYSGTNTSWNNSPNTIVE